MRSRFFVVSLLFFIALPLVAGAQSFQYDNGGRVTLATYPDGSSIGYEYDANSNVTRIRYNPSPTAALPPDGAIDTPADDVSIETGESVDFTGSASDPDGATPLTFRWDFDGGAPDSSDEDPGPVTFDTAGTYTVEFNVTDATNLPDPTPDTVTVTVTDPATVPPGGGGSDGNSGGDSGGGGSFLLLPFVLALFAFRRMLKPALVTLSLCAAAAHAQSWTEMNSTTDADLNDVWMASSGLAYAVGNNGTVLRFDGDTWSPVDVGTDQQLNGVWGTAPDDVWIVGAAGTVLRFDGQDWNPVVVDGAAGLPLHDVWTAGPGETVWIAGARGIWEYDGSTWARKPVRIGLSNTLDPSMTFNSIRGSANYILATVQGNRENTASAFAAQGSGGRFSTFKSTSNANGDMFGAWLDGDDFMLLVGESARLLDGGDPTSLTSADWQTINMGLAFGAWGSDRDNIWAVGPNVIRYYDGNPANDWSTAIRHDFRTFLGVHGIDASNVIAVGTLGTIYRLAEGEPAQTAAMIPYSGFVDGEVNARTGELVLETTDFSLNTQMPMEFRRYYASNLARSAFPGGRLGPNWSHNFEWSIETGLGEGGDEVRVIDYRGAEYRFRDLGAAFERLSPGWANVGLSRSGSGLVFFDRDSGLKYGFPDGSGLLSYVEDRNGNRHTLIYNQGFLVAISDGLTGFIELRYTATGRLERIYVEKATTLEVTLGYEDGVLATATDTAGVVTRHTYANQRYMTDRVIGSGTGDAYSTRRWEYNDANQVSAILLSGGRYSLSYAPDQTAISDPGSVQSFIRFDDDDRRISEQSALGSVISYGYDSAGRRTSLTDALGRATTWTFDDLSGQVESITEPGGFVTRFFYDPAAAVDGIDFYDVADVEFPDQATIEYGYDDAGNVDLVVDQEGNSWIFQYDDAGNVTRAENPLGAVTTYTYFSNGLPREITDSGGNQRILSYDPFLRVESDRIGNRTTQYSYSNRFLPDQVHDRSGEVIDYSYDQAGRLSRIDYSDGQFDQYAYDGSGRLVGLNFSNEETWTLGYDAEDRLASLANAAMQTSSYAYDADDRLSEYRDFDGRRWGFEYHADNRLQAVSFPGGDRIEYDYGDPRGLLSRVSSGAEQFSVTYDALRRVASATDAQERVNSIERNDRGDVERILQSPSNAERIYDTDVFGGVRRYTDPIGGVWERIVGNDGRLSRFVDPLGNVTALARDEENRADTVTFADGLEVTVDYAASGVPSRIEGSDGTLVEIDSTPGGDIVGGTGAVIERSLNGKVRNNNGIVVTPNANDRVGRMTFADGRFVDFEYNGEGDVTLIRDWTGAETLIVPTDVGKADEITFPNGIVTDYEYDRAKRIKSISISGTGGAIGDIVVNRDALGRIESIDRDLPNAAEFPSDDRIFEYDLASRMESGVYDARGNQLSRGGDIRVYDALNRLVNARDGADSVTISRDAFGNITGTAASSGDRVYVQNYALEKPRISIERDGAGNDLWYYIHSFKGRLLYRIDPAGNRQFYHFDESGNTVLMTDDAGNVIQSYFVTPHGEIAGRSGGVDNTFVNFAEIGGFNVGERVIDVSGKYYDSESAHWLSDIDWPDRLDPAVAEVGANPGRSGTVGELRKDVEAIEEDSTESGDSAELDVPGLGRFDGTRKRWESDAGCEVCEDYCDTCFYNPDYVAHCDECIEYSKDQRYSPREYFFGPEDPPSRTTGSRNAIPPNDPATYLAAQYDTSTGAFLRRDAAATEKGLRALGVLGFPIKQERMTRIMPKGFRLPPSGPPPVRSILNDVERRLVLP